MMFMTYLVERDWTGNGKDRKKKDGKKMPDYRRFIAYFYEYINGKRQRNAGFVKAEQRDGVWKINLQLKARRWPENGVEIYGYHSKGEVYPVTLLAKGYPQKDSLIQRIRLRANWETESGKTFETLSGMWIPCGEGRCFLSHWRDGEAEIQKLRIMAQQPEPGENAGPELETVEENTVSELKTVEENTVPELEAVETPGGIEQTFTNQPEDLSWQKPPKLRQEPQEFLEAMRKVLVMPEKMVENKAAEESLKVDEAGEITEISMKMKAAEKIAEESMEVKAAEKGTEEYANVKPVKKKSEHDMRTETEAVVMAEEIKEEAVQRREEKEKPFDVRKKTRQNQSQSRNDLIWQQMCNSHLKIMPFSGCECVVICPRDVLWLRQQGWSVGRNSFLMQGFSQYHHLLLGKREEGDFVLGVPGMGNQKNRSAAQAFGYGEFKAATEHAWKQEKENQSGKMSQEQFGYWCRIIK